MTTAPDLPAFGNRVTARAFLVGDRLDTKASILAAA